MSNPLSDVDVVKEVLAAVADSTLYTFSERYDMAYDLCVSGYSFENVQRRLERYAFRSDTYAELASRQNAQDEFISGGCAIEEGIFTCGKCGCKRCFSSSKQTRSCDEGATVMNMCSKCRHRWIVRG